LTATAADAMPNNDNLDEAVELVRPARVAVYDAMIEAMIEMSKILTPE
jgi:hypothetical protein